MILNISSYLYVPTSLGKIISLIMGMGINDTYGGGGSGGGGGRWVNQI